MAQQNSEWLEREKNFTAFTTGPLADFWRTREEGEFCGVGALKIRYIRFCRGQHQQVVMISPGRTESYVKYSEIAYDLFDCGFDVLIIDHRGQGLSERLLPDPQRGHVIKFSDYVDDFDRFYQQEIACGCWSKRYLLAQSMGSTICALWLRNNPRAFSAAVLCAPMFGIMLPLPEWMVRYLLSWAGSQVRIRDSFLPGMGSWRADPFDGNVLTHSPERFAHNQSDCVNNPELQLGGPTWHWLREAITAGEQVVADAAAIATPMLILQAESERVVDNRTLARFFEQRAAVGYQEKPFIIKGASHEILFEKDSMRAGALSAIINFFEQHH